MKRHPLAQSVAVLRCAALACTLVAGSAWALPTIGGCQVFPADNYWNTPVDTLPLHPSSTTWVNSVGATTRLHADWGNNLADNYGIPFITVPATQPRVPITFPPDGYDDESDPGPFPIPPNAPIEGGPASTGDRHVIVVDTGNCMLYELYAATPINGGASWSVYSSAKFDLNSNALRPAGWTSADAAGFAVFPGLVRWEEVAAGEIAHAIRFTAQRIWGRDAATNQPKYLWPARHWSGSSTDASRPPMGARFRLKASFDISGFDPRTQVILRAFKKYGIVLADAGSNWFFSGVSDTRWPDVVFSELRSINGGNFEVVDTSVLQADVNSARAASAPQSGPANYQDVWWGGTSQNGWGLNIAQHGNTLVGGWYVFGPDGRSTYYLMQGGSWNASFTTFTGPVFQSVSGAPFSNYNPAQFVPGSQVGTMTLTFSDANNAALGYTINGLSGSKSISRLQYGSGNATANYADVWWGGTSQNGWGIAIAQQGATLVGAWYTFGDDGKPVWYVLAGGTWINATTYRGPLTTGSGAPVVGVNYNAAQFQSRTVGEMTLTFSDANNAVMTYTVDNVTQSKAISRLAF